MQTPHRSGPTNEEDRGQAASHTVSYYQPSTPSNAHPRAGPYSGSSYPTATDANARSHPREGDAQIPSGSSTATGGFHQPTQYPADQPPPPNQYITPQGPRYHAPLASSTAGQPEIAPPTAMISQTYRSNAPPAQPYGQGMYANPPQSSTSTYMPQTEGAVSQPNQPIVHAHAGKFSFFIPTRESLYKFCRRIQHASDGRLSLARSSISSTSRSSIRTR